MPFVLPRDGWEKPSFSLLKDVSIRVVKSARRSCLHVGAALAPRYMGSMLARRYLASSAYLDLGKLGQDVSVLPVSDTLRILRFGAQSTGSEPKKRVLVIHGHDGHFRQFLRLLKILRMSGAEVDMLILPGHLVPEQTVCGTGDIVLAILAAGEVYGPYDAALGHCISANSLLFALERGFSTPRAVFVSAPIELHKLVAQGADLYGLKGLCRSVFIESVSQLFAPYPLELDWRPLAQARPENCLILHAKHDTAAPVEDVEILAKVLPHAQLRIFSQPDHNSILNSKSAMQVAAEFMLEDP